MFCEKCGNELVDGAAFCPSCGAAVGETAQQAQVTTASNAQRSSTSEYSCPNCGSTNVSVVKTKGDGSGCLAWLPYLIVAGIVAFIPLLFIPAVRDAGQVIQAVVFWGVFAVVFVAGVKLTNRAGVAPDNISKGAKFLKCEDCGNSFSTSYEVNLGKINIS